MLKIFVCLLFIIWIISACKKDAATIQQKVPPPIATDTTQPKISFIFINHSGYKADTNSVRWFQSVDLYSEYYDPKTNQSNLVNTAYNRNHNGWPVLMDSIEHVKYINYSGTQYAYQISLFWYYKDGIQLTRELKFQTKNWPNACDTIKLAKDTVIKFIYPDDTLPNNKFIRVQ